MAIIWKNYLAVFWRSLGRADDTMNLGGIKISSAEIENILQAIPKVKETAAIGVSARDGPSQLVVYVVCSLHKPLDRIALMISMQNAINRDLNPRFKTRYLVFIDALPKTASNKIIRGALRNQWKGT